MPTFRTAAYALLAEIIMAALLTHPLPVAPWKTLFATYLPPLFPSQKRLEGLSEYDTDGSAVSRHLPTQTVLTSCRWVLSGVGSRPCHLAEASFQMWQASSEDEPGTELLHRGQTRVVDLAKARASVRCCSVLAVALAVLCPLLLRWRAARVRRCKHYARRFHFLCNAVRCGW